MLRTNIGPTISSATMTSLRSQGGGNEEVEAVISSCCFPGTWHRYTPCPETGWDEFWIAFRAKTMQFGWLDRGFFSPANPVFKPARRTRSAQLVQREFRTELHTSPHGFMQVISRLAGYAALGGSAGA